MDYNSIPKNWTLKSLLQGLNLDQEALTPLLNDIRQFFSDNPDITELKTHASRDGIPIEATILRTRYSNLFAKVPTGSRVDEDVAEGCMKFIFNTQSNTRSRIKRETLAPSVILGRIPSPSMEVFAIF